MHFCPIQDDTTFLSDLLKILSYNKCDRKMFEIQQNKANLKMLRQLLGQKF